MSGLLVSIVAFVAMALPAPSPAPSEVSEGLPGPAPEAPRSSAVPVRRAAAAVQADVSFQRGVAAYRRGAYAEAEAHFRATLEEPLPDAERSRVALAIGNAAWRRQAELEAVGWYTRSVEADARNADAWHNLELARAKVGLEPADRGDLRSTVRRILFAPSPVESRWMVLVSLAVLAVALAGEALRGGSLWRGLSVAGGLLVLLAALPFVVQLRESAGDPVMIVRANPVALRSEPRVALAPIAEVGPGDRLERIDALPGWVRVETPGGTRGWLQEDAVFALGGERGG